jgi:ribonuclease T2
MFALLVGVLSAMPLHAEPASGTFVAEKSCDLFTSFRKSRNPDGLKTTPASRYSVQEINAPSNYEWLRIEVPGANPALRWVARECGAASLNGLTPPAVSAMPGKSLSRLPQPTPGPADTRAMGAGQCSTPNQQDSYVLAMTWQPGFCEHFAYKGRKPECDALNSGRIKISNLTLHGLWPNRQACGTNYGNCGGAPLQLSQATIKEIAPWMPNFFYEESFGRYEWEKHGSCQALDADSYFRTAVQAVKVVNDSAAGQLIVGNSGGKFRIKDFFATLQREYGSEVAAAFTLVCSEQKYLQEIRVELPLQFRLDQGLKGLALGRGGRLGRTQGCLAAEVLIEAPGR